MSKSVVVSRRVVLRTESGKYRIAPAAIFITNGLIEAVRELDDGEYSTTVKEMKEGKVEVRDLGQHLVSPAFVNPHTHLAMSFFRGFSIPESTKRNMIEDLFFHVESRLTAADVRAFTRMGAFECLLHGVGFAWDHYYFGEATARAFLDVGFSGVVCPTLQDLAGPGVAWQEQQWNDVATIADSRRMASAGVTTGLGVHATDTCSAALWRRAVDEARSRKIPLHAHVAQSYEEYEKVWAREGASPAEFLGRLGVFDADVSLLAVHGIYLSGSDLQLLRRGRVGLCFCPFSQMVFNFPAAVKNWEEAGIPWGVATDCVASNDSMNVQKELRFLAGIPNGEVTTTPAYAAFLKRGSAEGAAAVRAERARRQELSLHFSSDDFLLARSWEISPALGVSVGRIEAGFRANLVVWETEHPAFWPGTLPLRCLAMADTSAAISNMMVNGRWMGRDGDYARSVLSSHDYRDALREAKERLGALKSRL